MGGAGFEERPEEYSTITMGNSNDDYEDVEDAGPPKTTPSKKTGSTVTSKKKRQKEEKELKSQKSWNYLRMRGKSSVNTDSIDLYKKMPEAKEEESETSAEVKLRRRNQNASL